MDKLVANKYHFKKQEILDSLGGRLSDIRHRYNLHGVLNSSEFVEKIYEILTESAKKFIDSLLDSYKEVQLETNEKIILDKEADIKDEMGKLVVNQCNMVKFEVKKASSINYEPQKLGSLFADLQEYAKRKMDILFDTERRRLEKNKVDTTDMQGKGGNMESLEDFKKIMEEIKKPGGRNKVLLFVVFLFIFLFIKSCVEEKGRQVASSGTSSSAGLKNFNAPKLVINKIKFTERYAYEFDNYLGSENKSENMSRIIEENAVLRKHFNPNENIRLTPGIINLNEGIPLEEARIQLLFGQGVIVADHEGWAEQEVNSRYSCKFSEPINNDPLNTEHSIFLRFTHSGRYQIKVSIDGKYLKSTKEVNYFLELYE